MRQRRQKTVAPEPRARLRSTRRGGQNGNPGQELVLPFGATVQAALGLPPVSLVAPISVEADEVQDELEGDDSDTDDLNGVEVDLDEKWEGAAPSEDEDEW